MKLRIKGDSLRLRLTKSEVAQISAMEPVEARCRLGPDPAHQIHYRLQGSDQIDALQARICDGVIEVFLPGSQARDWASSDEVGFSAEQPIGEAEGQENLKLLIEKDFACLKPREGEDESDHYPHPNEGEEFC